MELCIRGTTCRQAYQHKWESDYDEKDKTSSGSDTSKPPPPPNTKTTTLKGTQVLCITYVFNYSFNESC